MTHRNEQDHNINDTWTRVWLKQLRMSFSIEAVKAKETN